MKNILQIMDYAAPYRGNFIPSIEALDAHWHGKGKMVFLFPEAAKNISWMTDFMHDRQVYFISRQFYSKKVRISFFQQLNHIIQAEKIDVIHTHFVTYSYSLYLYRLLHHNLRIIGHCHSEFTIMGKSMMVRLKKMVVNHLFDTMIGVSDFVADTIRMCVKRPQVLSIPNAIQFERLDNYDAQFRFPVGYDMVVMMFGWPYTIKGCDVAIRAIDKLRKQEHNILLAIGFSGPAEMLRTDIIADIGTMPDWVTILPPREDVATYYQQADIFLSASRTEGFSYALVEAAYCAPYLIISTIPAPMSLGIPHVGTYAVEDAEALADEILRYKSFSSETVKDYASDQRRYVTQVYNMDRWAEEVEQNY